MLNLAVVQRVVRALEPIVVKLDAEAAVKIAHDEDGVPLVRVNVIGEHGYKRRRAYCPECSRHPADVPQHGSRGQCSEAERERIFVRGGKKDRGNQSDEDGTERAACGDDEIESREPLRGGAETCELAVAEETANKESEAEGWSRDLHGFGERWVVDGIAEAAE